MSTNEKSRHAITEDENPHKGSVFGRIGSIADRKGSLDAPQETMAEYFEQVTAQEHALTFRQALKTERGVLLWGFVIGLAALSWGFDAQVVRFPSPFFSFFVVAVVLPFFLLPFRPATSSVHLR
jgi:hypothetical protein